MAVIDLQAEGWTHQDLADVVGVSRQAITALLSEGKLERKPTLGAMVHAYCERLRDQAAGRMGEESGGLDLVQERAALAREQRIAQALKNDIARGEYAPIGLLTDVLAAASSAVVDRFDHLEGDLAKACPDLPDDAKTAILYVLASARNQWIKSTAQLIVKQLEDLDDDDSADMDQTLEDES